MPRCAPSRPGSGSHVFPRKFRFTPHCSRRYAPGVGGTERLTRAKTRVPLEPPQIEISRPRSCWTTEPVFTAHHHRNPRRITVSWSPRTRSRISDGRPLLQARAGPVQQQWAGSRHAPRPSQGLPRRSASRRTCPRASRGPSGGRWRRPRGGSSTGARRAVRRRSAIADDDLLASVGREDGIDYNQDINRLRSAPISEQQRQRSGRPACTLHGDRALAPMTARTWDGLDRRHQSQPRMCSRPHKWTRVPHRSARPPRIYTAQQPIITPMPRKHRPPGPELNSVCPQSSSRSPPSSSRRCQTPIRSACSRWRRRLDSHGRCHLLTIKRMRRFVLGFSMSAGSGRRQHLRKHHRRVASLERSAHARRSSTSTRSRIRWLTFASRPIGPGIEDDLLHCRP